MTAKPVPTVDELKRGFDDQEHYAAKEFEQKGFTASVIGRWIAEGWSVKDAQRVLQQGLDPADLLADVARDRARGEK